MEWRRDFIRTYLERDVPQFGSRIPAETLRRFWTMLAHNQTQILNAANLARGLGVDGKTVAGYLDLLVDLLLVRRLPAWRRNLGKRLVKSPKVYVRDTGIAHALLGIRDKEALLGHPVVGQTWESFAIETLIATAPDGTEAHYYRTSNGTEIDLVLTLPGGKLWAIEVNAVPHPGLSADFIQPAPISIRRSVLSYIRALTNFRSTTLPMQSALSRWRGRFNRQGSAVYWGGAEDRT
jgi:predicted AAA+ superfamily ATPase